MAENQPQNVCNCCDSPCPVPFQQREVRSLVFYASPNGGNAPYVNQEDLDEALAELKALPWRGPGGTAISYCYTVVGTIYMSESRARQVVPPEHYYDTNIQDYAKYRIGTAYNGGSGTTYTYIDYNDYTWSGPGSASIESRASPWQELSIDGWAVPAGQQNLNHRGFIERVNYTCYDTVTFPPLT